MRIKTTTLVLLAAAIAACSSTQTAPEPAQPELTWMPAPAVFQPGAQMAVLQGDPGGTGEFTIRLKMPDGYKIAPHTHPTDEHVTVISGAFKVAMGSAMNVDSMATLDVGGFVTAPAGHAHYAMAKGATIVQVHALGPFALTYVNPNDLPRAAVGR